MTFCRLTIPPGLIMCEKAHAETSTSAMIYP